MPKNIVICCDGTAGTVKTDALSNVVLLYRILQKNDKQVLYYDPGMAVLGNPTPYLWVKKWVSRALIGLLGFGVDESVLKAYRFLIHNYEDGDQIYLFGYSRGAYTVRVLAGFIHLLGLLKPEHENLCEHAFGSYRRASEGDFEQAWLFKSVLSTRERIPIKFIGVWDTVSSVIVPKFQLVSWKKLEFLPIGFKLERLPHTDKNKSVEIFRHALAIDERRRLFSCDLWTEPQPFDLNFFNPKDNKDQDIKQVWFSGHHGDVGGGHPEKESGLSKISLKWMADEAKEAGLIINTAKYNRYVMGKPRRGSKREYVAPDHMRNLHDKMALHWWLHGLLTGHVYFEKGKVIPVPKPRKIPENALLHESVLEKIDKDSRYKPINIPEKYVLFKDSA